MENGGLFWNKFPVQRRHCGCFQAVCKFYSISHKSTHGFVVLAFVLFILTPGIGRSKCMQVRHLYFWSEVNIWNVNCARATAFIFDTRTGVLVKVSKLFETENVSTWSGLEPPIFGFMPNALTIWAIRASMHILRVSSLNLRQSYGCPSVSEVIPKNMHTISRDLTITETQQITNSVTLHYPRDVLYKGCIYKIWWRHQMESFSALLALCAGNSPGPVNSPHKGQWRGALMFSLIYTWINDWVNNREAGDFLCHRGHYNVNVMNEIMGRYGKKSWKRKQPQWLHYTMKTQVLCQNDVVTSFCPINGVSITTCAQWNVVWIRFWPSAVALWHGSCDIQHSIFINNTLRPSIYGRHIPDDILTPFSCMHWKMLYIRWLIFNGICSRWPN